MDLRIRSSGVNPTVVLVQLEEEPDLLDAIKAVADKIRDPFAKAKLRAML